MDSGALHWLELAGVMEGFISCVAGALMFACCVIGLQHSHARTPQNAILHILAWVAACDSFLAGIWSAGCLMRVCGPPPQLVFLILIGLGVFAIVGSTLWTVVFTWYVTSTLLSGGRADSFWRHRARIYCSVFLASGALAVLLVVRREDWPTHPFVLLFDLLDSGGRIDQVEEAEQAGRHGGSYLHCDRYEQDGTCVPSFPLTWRGWLSLWTYRLFALPAPVFGMGYGTSTRTRAPSFTARARLPCSTSTGRRAPHMAGTPSCRPCASTATLR
jgi:hypothetical protein